MWVIFLSSWKDLNYQPCSPPLPPLPHDDLKCPSVQFLVNLCGAAGVHAERLRCGGGLEGVSGSHGHADMDTGPLWDFGARWRPVEGLQHGHMDTACGAHLFLPQPLLHALKHIFRRDYYIYFFSTRPNAYDFCRYWFPSLMPGGNFQHADLQ